MPRGEKYYDLGGLADFGLLANAFDTGKGEDGDTGAMFPRSDAEDLSRGARFIPYEVTEARRSGKVVTFHTKCQCSLCWYWQLPGNTRIYHFVRWEYEDYKSKGYTSCPQCGNRRLTGGKVVPK